MFAVNDIHPLTDFQRNAKEHVKRLKNTKKPEVLTINGKPSLVIQDAEEYEKIIDLLDSMKHIKTAAEAFHSGKGESVENFFNKFEDKYGLSGDKI